jgi:hypothetical protein
MIQGPGGTSTERFIEYFAPQMLYDDEFGRPLIATGLFAHCGATYDGGPPQQITGITQDNPVGITMNPTVPVITPGSALIANPNGWIGSSVSAGGSLPTRNYAVVFTFTNSNGETLPSTPVYVIPVAQSYYATLGPPGTIPSGATGWNLYVDIAGGSNFTKQNAAPILTSSGMTEPVLGFTNTGPAPPTENTTNGFTTTMTTGFNPGDKVTVTGVVGMTEINSNSQPTSVYTVLDVADSLIHLTGIDGRAWSAYMSGGTVQKVVDSVTGLDWLDGYAVDVLIDGFIHPQQTISGGILDLDWYGNLIQIGLHYQTIIEPMKPNAGSQQGTARGKKQKITRATLIFYQTYGCKYGNNQDELYENFEEPFVAGELFAATKARDKQVDFDGEWKDDATVSIVHDYPTPFTLLGIVPDVSLQER